MTNENLLALASGYKLNHYIIDSVLGQGGFGIVYKAHHDLLNESVVIKEFLPVELAGRSNNTVMPHTSKSQNLFDECRRRFVEEGRVLIRLNHPYVVRCRDLFEANGTAYLVMDFEEGLALDTLLNSLESQGGKYSESQLLFVLTRLAQGLQYVHEQQVLHRDIKPGNVFVRRKDNTPVLLDFGAAKQNYAEASQSQAPFTEFYAPIDQLDTSAPPTAAIDIHAFGGLMYRAVTGEIGPKAETRSAKLSMGQVDPLIPAFQISRGKYSDQFLTLIDECLAFKPDDRPKSMKVVADRLQAMVAAAGESEIDVDANEHAYRAGSATEQPSFSQSNPSTSGQEQQDPYAALDDLLGLAGADNTIDNSEMKMLQAKAAQLGIPAHDAQRYITQKAHQNGWQLTTPGGEGAAPSQEERPEPSTPQKEVPKPQVERVKQPWKEKEAEKKNGKGKVFFVIIALLVLGAGIFYGKEILNQPKYQYLTVNTDPINASIKVENLDASNGGTFYLSHGIQRRLKEGRYRITITSDGFKEESDIQVIKDRSITRSFDLESTKNRLWVKTTPSNARVFLMDIPDKYAPGIALKPLTYKIKVKADGYKTADRTVDLSAGDKTINVSLTKINYSSLGYKEYDKKNYKKAIEYYKKAAAEGNANAMDWVGYFYREGKGVTRNYSEARKWFKKSADKGHSPGMGNLAQLYLTGRGVTKNYQESLKWYRKAADKGHAYSIKQLGNHYENGYGVVQNYTEAMRYYKKAADKKYVSAYHSIGVMYYYGRGVKVNYSEAYKWFEKGANGNNASSMSFIGNMYEYAKGKSKSISKAVEWYRKAAKKGNSYAKDRLKELGYSY